MFTFPVLSLQSETLSESPEEDGPGGEEGDGEGSEVTTPACLPCPSSSSSSSSAADPWTGSPRKRTQTLPSLGVREGGGQGGAPHRAGLRRVAGSPTLPALDSAPEEKGTLSEDIFKILDLQNFSGATRGGHAAAGGRSNGGAVATATHAPQPAPHKPGSGGSPPQPRNHPPHAEQGEGRAEREAARPTVPAPSPQAKGGPQKNTPETPESRLTRCVLWRAFCSCARSSSFLFPYRYQEVFFHAESGHTIY